MSIIHSSRYEPRVYPHNADNTPAEIDRLQELSGQTSLNREKINEIGRDGTVGWKTAIPEVQLTARQLEYGAIEFWNKICNKTDANTTISQTDFDTATFDIAGYKTDNDGTFVGTVWYPALRTASWSLNIGDPEALIERNFSFVGEDNIVWTDNNKYVVYVRDNGAVGTYHQIVFGSGGFANYPDPVADPDQSGSAYFIRILRVRSGTTTELTEGTDFTYNSGTQIITFPTSAASDIYKIWYTATTYISGGDPFVENDSDLSGISADSCTILLETSNTVTRLQSVSVEVSFDRQDVKEIGNSEVVSRGVRQRTVRITLGRILDSYTVENKFRGALSSTYGKYDVRKYADDLKITIKIYNNSDKDTFKIGYSFTNLSPVSQEEGTPTKDFITKGSTLEGEEFVISTSEGAL